jgi:hypothetical protein
LIQNCITIRASDQTTKPDIATTPVLPGTGLLLLIVLPAIVFHGILSRDCYGFFKTNFLFTHHQNINLALVASHTSGSGTLLNGNKVATLSLQLL